MNEWSEFREVGDYYVAIALVPQFGMKADTPPTADLHVGVGPRNESKLGAVAKALADLAINGHDVGDRSEAALALSYVADPIAIPEMARVLASESDAGLPLTEALVRMGGPSALEALKAAQGNPHEWIRDAADRALQALHQGKPLVRPKVAD